MLINDRVDTELLRSRIRFALPTPKSVPRLRPVPYVACYDFTRMLATLCFCQAPCQAFMVTPGAEVRVDDASALLFTADPNPQRTRRSSRTSKPAGIAHRPMPVSIGDRKKNTQLSTPHP